MEQPVLTQQQQNKLFEEAKLAEERYGNLPRKKIRPAPDKKVLPDSVEIARELEQHRLAAELARVNKKASA